MSQTIHERLNQIPERILSTEFLTGQGLGNEIGFWIFDYAPEDELKVREYLHFLDGMLEKKHSQLKVVNINLLQAVVDYLAERNFIDKAILDQGCNSFWDFHECKYYAYIVRFILAGH